MRPCIVALAVLVLSLTAGAAAAGSRANPEVVDAAGDTLNPLTAAPLAHPNLDVRAVWFVARTDAYEVHLRVADLPAAFRGGTTLQQWEVRFDADGVTWVASVARDSFGRRSGALGAEGVALGGQPPSTAAGTATVAFDDARDEIVLTLPARFTVAVSGASRAFDWSDAAFAAPRARAMDGSGAAGCAGACAVVDHTAPGRTFRADEPAGDNPHVVLVPPSAPVLVKRGTVAVVPLSAESASPLDLGLTLTATVSRADWTLEDPTKDLALDATGKATGSLRVAVPPFAAPGDTAVVTVTGGAFPVGAVLVVADDADSAAAKEAAKLADPLPAPDHVERTVRPWTLHLQGTTLTSGSPPRPILAGRLVGVAPSGSGNDTMRIAGAPFAPVGEWTSEPLAAPANVTGALRAELWAGWTNVNGIRLRALVGPAPLPLDWDGGAAPPGTFVLEGGAGPVTASRAALAAGATTSTHLPLQTGDRLAVALFLARSSGGGDVDVFVFGKDTPSKLTVGLEEPVVPTLVPAVAPAGKIAAFGAALAPPAGLASVNALVGTLAGPDGSAQLPFVAVPRDAQVGNATDRPGTRTLAGTSFAPTLDEGVERVHAFFIGPAARQVEIVLDGDNVNDRTNDNDLDLLVRKADGTFVRASRSDGADERIVLGPALLALHGPGRYDAVVRFDRTGSGQAQPVGYQVVVTQHDGVLVENAHVDVRFLWSYAGRPVGDYTLESRFDDGRGGSARAVAYRLTDVGPTLPPVADFRIDPAIAVSGQRVNFTDASRDLDGRVLRWTWDFADGTVVTCDAAGCADAAGRIVAGRAGNLSHAFPRPGTYGVTLTVTDDFNATAVSAERLVDVGNAPPVAAFRTEPIVGIAGQTVRFVDESFDPDGNISDRAWSFGDGTGSSDAVVEHVYDVPGSYNVSLTVFDEPRSVLAGSRLVRVFVVVEPGAVSSGRPSADFEPPLNPVEGRPVRFTDASFWAEGILERRWDFGDGGVSSETHPLHVFAAAGEYQVTLTVFPPGRQDLTASLTRTVRVMPSSGVAAAFSMEPASPATSDVVAFRDATTVLRGEVTRHWDFGDGVTAAGANVTHVFARPGTFVVRLTVSDRDGSQAVAERLVAVVRTPLVADPAPETPHGGTLLHYKDDYDRRVEHKEDYAATWRDIELTGALKAGSDYLGGGAYAYGTAPAALPEVRWQGGAATLATPAGATVTALGAEVATAKGSAVARSVAPPSAAIGSRPVDLSALDAPPAARDDAGDGLFRVESVLAGGGIEVRRSVTHLAGALHADVRTLMTGRPDDPMRLVTETVLAAPEGSWIATWDGDGVRAMPVEGADNVTYDLGGYANRWFAVYDPARREVAGVVVAGDATGITLLRRGGDVVVRVDHVGLGDVLAAEYLVAYEVGDADATRYAGVMELARQDDEEVGLAVLGDDAAAALAWAGARAQIGVDARGGLSSLWGRMTGVPDAWTVEVDAPSAASGKAMRIVLPARVLADGGVRVLLDGVELSPLDYDALADDRTLVLTVPVESFSRHVITVESVVPGLPRAFLWLGLVLGVVGGGAGAYAFERARRREEPESVELEPAPPAVAAAFDDAAAAATRAALLRKLGAGDLARFAACAACGAPLGTAAPGAPCPRCGRADPPGGAA